MRPQPADQKKQVPDPPIPKISSHFFYSLFFVLFRQRVLSHVFGVRGLEVLHHIRDELGRLEGQARQGYPFLEGDRNFLAAGLLRESDLCQTTRYLSIGYLARV